MAGRKRDRDDEPQGGDYSSPEKPWDEARWEEEFRRNDARADRFGELLETLMDHPDRDELVAREMGWNDLADDLVEYDRAKAAGELDEDAEADDDDDDMAGLLFADADEAGEEDDDGAIRDPDAAYDDEDLILDGPAEAGGAVDADDDDAAGDAGDPFAEEDEHDRELKQIPAYVMAHDLGLKIDKLFKPYMKGTVDDDPSDGRFGEAWIGMFNAAVKISGGHSLGYDDEFLCGNIVKNKIALASVDKSIDAFLSLKADGLLPAELVDQVLPEARKVRDAIAERIAELRKRVWW